MEPFVVAVSHHKPALPFDIHNEKLSHLQKCGHASLVDIISAKKNKELAEKILLNTTFTGDTVSIEGAGIDALVELLSQKEESTQANVLYSLAALAPSYPIKHASIISAKLGWNKIISFLDTKVPITIAQGAAALVANLTTNGDSQKSVVTSGALKSLIALLSLKDPLIDRSAVYAFANAATNPATESKALMSNDLMGAILKRIESEEDETIMLPFAKALHHFALQESNRPALSIAHPLLIGWAMVVGEDLHQCALDTLALLDALGSSSDEIAEAATTPTPATVEKPVTDTSVPIPSSNTTTAKPVAPARPARPLAPSNQAPVTSTGTPTKPITSYPSTPGTPSTSTNPKPPTAPRTFKSTTPSSTVNSPSAATPPATTAATAPTAATANPSSAQSIPATSTTRPPSPSPAYVPSPILGRPPSPAAFASPILGRPPSPASTSRFASPSPLSGKSPPPPPRVNTLEPSPAPPVQLSPKSYASQAVQTSPPRVRLSPPTPPITPTTPAPTSPAPITPTTSTTTTPTAIAKPPTFTNKFHAKPTHPVTPSTPSDPVFTSPPPAIPLRSPSPIPPIPLQSSKSSPSQKPGEKKTVVITSPIQPASEQVEKGDEGEGEKKKEKEESVRDLLQRSNSSPSGLRPKRKESGKGKHTVVSPDDISHIRSLDPNTDPFAGPSSRLPKMPLLAPRESLKNSSVLLFSRKVSDMSIPPARAELSKQDQRELRAQQAQLLMQHHQQQLLEQQRKQRELEAEQLLRHAEQWTPLREGLRSGDLSEQLKGVDALLELVKGEDIVPAVLGGVLVGLNEALRAVQLEQFKLDALYVIHCIAPRSPLSEHIVESGIVATLVESLASLDEHSTFFEGTIAAITLLATHHEKVQTQIQSINGLDIFATVS